jgi:hypothetical protein
MVINITTTETEQNKWKVILKLLMLQIKIIFYYLASSWGGGDINLYKYVSAT